MEISISPNGLSAAYLNVFNPTSKLSIVNEFWSSDFCGNTLDTRSASLFCAFLRPHYDQTCGFDQNFDETKVSRS